MVEQRQQREKHQALRVRVSIKQEATEQQLAVYQQRVEFMEKLLDQLKKGTACNRNMANCMLEFRNVYFLTRKHSYIVRYKCTDICCVNV